MILILQLQDFHVLHQFLGGLLDLFQNLRVDGGVGILDGETILTIATGYKARLLAHFERRSTVIAIYGDSIQTTSVAKCCQSLITMVASNWTRNYSLAALMAARASLKKSSSLTISAVPST